MNESASQIKTWLEALEEMIGYLDYLDYKDIFTMLDKKGGFIFKSCKKS